MARATFTHAYDLTTECGWFQPLFIMKAYEDKKMQVRPTDRVEYFLSNGEIPSLQTSFCTVSDEFCCSPSAALAGIWNSRPDNKCNVAQKFVFPHQRCYGSQLFWTCVC